MTGSLDNLTSKKGAYAFPAPYSLHTPHNRAPIQANASDEKQPNDVVATARTSLQRRADAMAFGTPTDTQLSSSRSLRLDDVFAVGKSGADALEEKIVKPRRKAAFSVADFHKDMLRLKADLEALGKADEDGKHYTVSLPKAIAMILLMLRKWDKKELTTVSEKDMPFQEWKDMLVNVKETKSGANGETTVVLDAEAVLAEIVGKFVPEGFVTKGKLDALRALQAASFKHAQKMKGSDAAAEEEKWLKSVIDTTSKHGLINAGIALGIKNKDGDNHEVKIPAQQWNATVYRLDAEVTPWQHRVNVTMQKAQHDQGLVNSFWAKIGEMLRSMITDARSAVP